MLREKTARSGIVMSGVNPQGVDVFSFKSPSSEEMSHDFLWRTNRSLPPRGKIGIFNRSYYEEVPGGAGALGTAREPAHPRETTRGTLLAASVRRYPSL